MMGIETMKSVSPKTVDRSTLVQRSSIRLDPAAPREDRLREFIKQIRNPYCYLDGKTVVKISFAETDTTMEDCLTVSGLSLRMTVIPARTFTVLSSRR